MPAKQLKELIWDMSEWQTAIARAVGDGLASERFAGGFGGLPANVSREYAEAWTASDDYWDALGQACDGTPVTCSTIAARAYLLVSDGVHEARGDLGDDQWQAMTDEARAYWALRADVARYLHAWVWSLPVSPETPVERELMAMMGA